MSKIIIVTETGSDIPKATAKELGIEIVPMHVTFGGQTYDDGSIEPSVLINHYYTTKELPKTSGSTPYDFETAFDRIHEENPDALILYLAYSAVTTVSYASAMLYAKDHDFIIGLDTKTVSIGLGSIVIRAAEYNNAHPDCTIEELKAVCEDYINRSRMCFLPDTLDFLHAGGRVSNAAYMGAKLLSIHPCIELKDGYLVATKKYRGTMKKLLRQLILDYEKNYNLERERVWIIYVEGFSDEFKAIAEGTCKEAGFQKVEFVRADCVITSHGGPGAFGMVGFAR